MLRASAQRAALLPPLAPNLAILPLLRAIYCLQAGRGDLWVTYSVAFPKSISDEQRRQLKALFGGSAEWRRQQLAHEEL